MSTRELIEGFRRELRDEDLSPMRGSEVLTKLTALMGNVLAEIREAEAEFNGVLLKFLDSDEAANRAKIRAQATPEYARAKEAKDTQTVLLAMIQSLKVVLKVQTEELKATR
jgi:hypothetical protein